jgi:glycosyltransferase involved in cell wall biosynthesis
MENITVSIIIPVYKAENYIRRCLDSVVGQTCKGNYEVIVIDDGSPDRSGEICDEYSKKFSVVKVFHQSNKGVAKTREIGIKKAQGKYIVWVDADDFADSTLVESVLQKVKVSHADLILYGVQYQNYGIVTKEQIPRKEEISAMRRKSITGQYSTLWRFASLREYWLDEKVPEEMERSAEDGYMSIRIFMKAQNIEAIPKILYYHIGDNPNSIRHTCDGKYYMGNFSIWYYRLHICERDYKDLITHCASRAFSGAVKAYSMSLIKHDLSEKFQKELIEALRDLKGYPIGGRLRDKFLGWCIMNHVNGPCRWYATHKIEKLERKNKKIFDTSKD